MYRLVAELPQGTSFNALVAERCAATSGELVAGGEAACPAGSRVGTGELETDGGELAGRKASDLVVFNSGGGALSVLVQPRDGSARQVLDATLSGKKLEVQPPLSPGPPEAAVAIRRVRVRVDQRTIRVARVKRFRVRVPVATLRSGAHTVNALVTDTAGSRAFGRVRFRRC